MSRKGKLAVAAIGAVAAALAVYLTVLKPDWLSRLIEAFGPEPEPITCAGADSMVDLLQSWSSELSKAGGPRVEVRGGGSAIGFASLTSGTVALAFLCRPLDPREVSAFLKARGHPPTAVRVGSGAIRIWVHPTNTLASLDLAALKAIFLKRDRSRGDVTIETWGELGLTGEWANRPIRLYGPRSPLGFTLLFRQSLQPLGELKEGLTPVDGPHSAPAVAVAADPAGIAFTGSDDGDARVRAVPLCARKGGMPVAPSAGTAASGAYPLAFPLLLAFDRPPAGRTPRSVRALLEWALSPRGQGMVAAAGHYYPLPDSTVGEEKAKVR